MNLFFKKGLIAQIVHTGAQGKITKFFL